LKKLLIIVVCLAAVSMLGVLMVLLVDAGVSLDHSRQQNRFSVEKCRLLVKIADAGWRGHQFSDMRATLGPNVTVKREGKEVRLDDTVVVTLEEEKIIMLAPTTCE